LAKQFKCPFCANDDVVECKMDFRNGVGSLDCRLCGASYQMPVHHLHEPIDVFSEWLDDCEAAQRPQVASTEGAAPQYDDEEEDDDDIPEASGLGSTTAAAKPAAKAQEAAAPSYSALGLDDSDDDDDEDD
jgi:transcription elongation factor Elf1